jgi:MFS family permease
MYIVISLLLVGIGNGIFNTPNSSALMGSVTPQQRPVASSILGTTRNVGMSFGIALATGLFAFYQGRYRSFLEESTAFITAYHNIIYVAIVIAAVGIPFCLVRKNK